MSAHYTELLARYATGDGLVRLVKYAELLERWSARHNLVRFASREELASRHIGEALAAVPLLGPARRLLDIGSGGGLPGVPLLAVAEGLEGCLVEPRQKRWAFLRMVIRELGLDAEVERCRYHELPAGAPWDVITVRAVGHHWKVAEWSRRRVRDGGQVLLWTTAAVAAELEAAEGWHVVSSPLPGLDRGRLVRLQPCFT